MRTPSTAIYPIRCSFAGRFLGLEHPEPALITITDLERGVPRRGAHYMAQVFLNRSR